MLFARGRLGLLGGLWFRHLRRWAEIVGGIEVFRTFHDAKMASACPNAKR